MEDFSVEAFVAQLAVEGFAVAVLPRTSGFDVERLGAKLCEQLRTIFAVITAPSSERMCSGTPRSSITSAAAMGSSVNFQPTNIRGKPAVPICFLECSI